MRYGLGRCAFCPISGLRFESASQCEVFICGFVWIRVVRCGFLLWVCVARVLGSVWGDTCDSDPCEYARPLCEEGVGRLVQCRMCLCGASPEVYRCQRVCQRARNSECLCVCVCVSSLLNAWACEPIASGPACEPFASGFVSEPFASGSFKIFVAGRAPSYLVRPCLGE